MWRLTVTLLVLAALSGCQVRGPLDENAYGATVPEGSRFVLTRDLQIPTGWARVTIQDGTLISRRELDRFRAYCELETRTLSRPGEPPQVVRADTFISGAVRRRYAKGSPTLVAGLLMRDDDSPKTYRTTIRLQSAQQPSVRLLACEYTGDRIFDYYLTIAQIRAVLGDIFSLELNAGG